MTIGRLLLVAAAATLAAGTALAQERTWTPITQDFLNNPPDGEWASKRRTPNGWGYSPLTQINRDNVGSLELAWAFDTGATGNKEWTPAVANGIMFVHANDRVLALDAASGDLIWQYQITLLPAERRTELGVGGGTTTRGVTLYEDKVLVHTGDSHIVALDTLSGQEIWKTFTDGLGYSSPGIIADGVLISGNRAKNYDRGFITGVDTSSGEILWKTWAIPGPGEPGYDSWTVPGTAEVGHGSVWGTPTYDPDLNIVYVTVGNPDPYTNQTREGDNLYTQSLLAMAPKTGEILWYHQFVPNDAWDLDSIMEAVLFDAEIDGEMRHLLIHTGKSSFTNVLDRETGEYIGSRFVTYTNVFTGVDDSGRPIQNEAVIPRPGERVVACPSTRGGTDWPARAYSPDTGLYYISGNHVCMDVEGLAYAPGDPMRNLDDRRVIAPGYDYIGELFAIDAATLETAWTVKYDYPTSAIPLPTAGGLVFAGTIDRYFVAYNDETGEELWRQRISQAIEAHPISYEVDGVQYVAVPSGCCSIVGGGFANELTPEIMGPTGTGHIWAFRLPQD
ncbi:MAG: PQQ-binding-like beta-propeller repeat protein [Bauldia sp.]|nr:PQQ-binding-like beta-propeller repeat protein [Bauldia sp.]